MPEPNEITTLRLDVPSGTPVTSLPVTLTTAVIAPNQVLTLGYGTASPVSVTATAFVPQQSLNIPVSSFTPSVLYSAGTIIADPTAETSSTVTFATGSSVAINDGVTSSQKANVTLAPVDGQSNTLSSLQTTSFPESFNGTTWDRLRNNLAVSVQASSAQTTTQTSADQTNYNHRGIHFIVDVTAAGTGSITPKIQGKDANGIYYDLLVGTAITSIGTTVLKLYPGILTLSNASASDILPRTFRLVVTANNANSVTYSQAYQLVV